MLNGHRNAWCRSIRGTQRRNNILNDPFLLKRFHDLVFIAEVYFQIFNMIAHNIANLTVDIYEIVRLVAIVMAMETEVIDGDGDGLSIWCGDGIVNVKKAMGMATLIVMMVMNA